MLKRRLARFGAAHFSFTFWKSLSRDRAKKEQPHEYGRLSDTPAVAGG